MSIKSFLKRKFTKIEKYPIYIPIEQNNILANRCAIVTGGSSGIGFAIAHAFLSSGCSVIITGRNTDKLENALKKLKSETTNSAFAYRLDIDRVESFDNAIVEMERLAGLKIDILVNCAGISGKTSFPNISVQDYDQCMLTNLKGVLFLAQSFANYMIKHEIGGNILNIGSSLGLKPANSPYSVSKWGIRAITLGMAKTLIKHNIVVNGLAPGLTNTTMVTNDPNNLYNSNNPPKRLTDTQELANMAVRLVSSECRMIVGDMLTMSGGTGILTYDDVDYY